MSNKVSTKIKQYHLCPICGAKRLLSATQVHVNGANTFSNGVALTPPMGWASWNLFRHNINEELIEQIAKAMHDAHLDELGYQYVNIDDCWMSSSRTPDGKLIGDLATFPSGIKALVDKVNAYGLKVGIYTSNGTATCENLPSSMYHEATDARTFAEWGIEYFKYDFCNNEAIPTTAPEIDKLMIAKSGEKEFLTLLASEAELRGNATVFEDKKMSANGKYVGGMSSNAGSIVFNNVEVPEDGEYTLTLGIHKAGYRKKFAEIIVNGTDIYEVTVPATLGQTHEGRCQTTVKLNAGINTVLIHNPISSRMDSSARQYRNMGQHLVKAAEAVAAETGKPVKPICFSICEWGLNQPWKWGATAGNLWRTTPDIKAFWASIMAIYEVTVRLYKHSGPGNWNDPDMLEVGVGNLTDDENKAHFSLWCMMNAPLILGNDVRTFIREDGSVDTSNKVLKVISNKNAIAINQDKLGIQCRRIATNGIVDVLVKPLENREIAVCLLNKGSSKKEAKFSIKDILNESYIELPDANRYTVYDIWNNTTFIANNTISQMLRPHSVALYRIKAMG